MSTNDTYLAVFQGKADGGHMKAWMAIPEAERHAKEREGIAAWKAWATQHHAAIAEMGGPLGKAKSISERGTEDESNGMCGFVIVRAESHEAAARMFENHPHFTIFPGDSVTVMPVMPIPAG